MSEGKTSQILIVEDDVDLAEMLNAYFRVQGYEVLTATWGEDAVRMAQDIPPDIILLDIRLPDIDGYEVCRQLREHRRTRKIPIIFLTEKRERKSKLAGLELGAVDYVTKPFDIQELRLRVRNTLRRVGRSPQMNPVTGLPERSLVDEFLQGLLEKPEWTLVVVSMMGLDRFREEYGFVAADDVLRAASLMVVNAVREVGGASDFVGHLGHTDFVVVTNPDRAATLQSRVLPRLKSSVPYFYPIKDRVKAQQSSDVIRVFTGALYLGEQLFSDVDELKTALLRTRRAG